MEVDGLVSHQIRQMKNTELLCFLQKEKLPKHSIRSEHLYIKMQLKRDSLSGSNLIEQKEKRKMHKTIVDFSREKY